MAVFKAFGISFILFSYAVHCARECYENEKLRAIPPNHLYHKLRHPCVIGHMGNIGAFQENTLDGIRSLIEIKADGIHMHVQLTEDNQLVLFQDDNLYRMTTEDFEVSLLPYREIQKMNLQKEIPYYKNKDDYNNVVRTFTYDTTQKIPLLQDALEILKGKGLLVYIELMPNRVSSNPLQRYLALKTGELTANLVKELGMVNDVLIVSRDIMKLAGVNFYHPEISFGWWADPSLYEKGPAETMKKKFNSFPRVHRLNQNCLNKTGATGFSFTKYLISSGFISKVVNTSFIDFSVDMFKEKLFFQQQAGQSTLQAIVKSNYGDATTMGAFNVFTWNDTAPTTAEDDENYINTVKAYGVSRILTDDVNRVKRSLKKETINLSKGTWNRSYFELVIVLLMAGKTILCLLYI